MEPWQIVLSWCSLTFEVILLRRDVGEVIYLAKQREIDAPINPCSPLVEICVIDVCLSRFRIGSPFGENAIDGKTYVVDVNVHSTGLILLAYL